MMVTITLSDQERRQLEDVFQTTPNGRLRTRCQAVLMAHRGRWHSHIAGDLGVNVRTLPRWLRVYQDKGLAGLKLRWRPGRRARIPAALAPEILGWIWPGPAGCGVDRATWTDAELATRLYRTHGITVRASTRRALCTQDGVRPDRPMSYDLKADPAPQAMARQDLQALKNRPRPEQLKKARSGPRCLPEGFARHLREIARAYPAPQYPRVVLVSDTAPWHRGALLTKVLYVACYSEKGCGGCCRLRPPAKAPGPDASGRFCREGCILFPRE
jgi:transposase